MKKIYFIILFIFSFSNTFAQKYLPVIKQGTKINYNVAARATGATAAINLTLVSLTDTVKINWQVPYVGGGSYAIPPKAMQSGTKLVVNEPPADEVTQLQDDEVLIFLSRDLFKSLVNNKTFTLSGRAYNMQPDTSNFKINDKPADVFYAVSVKGDRELWILDNPDFPLICRSRRAAKALDFYLVSVLNN